jgi:hypothetical protein
MRAVVVPPPPAEVDRLLDSFVPPISVVLARDKDRYLKGLTLFREDRLADWIELFAAATAEAATLAAHYAIRVGDLQDRANGGCRHPHASQ